MIPLMKMGMVTGKTERQTASWLKSATAVNRSAADRLTPSTHNTKDKNQTEEKAKVVVAGWRHGIDSISCRTSHLVPG